MSCSMRRCEKGCLKRLARTFGRNQAGLRPAPREDLRPSTRISESARGARSRDRGTKRKGLHTKCLGG